MARPGPDPSWRRLNPHLERDVRELVRHVAGLRDDGDPNFQLCLHFAWSNFRYGARAGPHPGIQRGSRAGTRRLQASEAFLASALASSLWEV